jgi:predicted DNA-binding transcriptional regulator YafY
MRDEEQFFRRLILLRHLPPCGRGKTTVQALHTVLERENHSCRERTVQRDLVWLANRMLVQGDEHKPQGWCLDAAKGLGIPMMDVGTAVTWTMAEKVLEPLFPKSLLDELAIYRNQAQATLSHSALHDWSGRVVVLQEGMQRPARPLRDAHATLLLALEQRKQIEMTYRPSGSPSSKEHILHPWGLVLRDGTLYTVGLLSGRDTPTLFAIHRIERLVMLDEQAAPMPPEFSLGTFARETLALTESGKRIFLRLQVIKELAHLLEERPLSEDQRIERRGRIWVTFTATVMDSLQLRWWLLSYGAAMRVVDPAELFHEMKDRIGEMIQCYSRRPNWGR